MAHPAPSTEGIVYSADIDESPRQPHVDTTETSKKTDPPMGGKCFLRISPTALRTNVLKTRPPPRRAGGETV